MVCASFAFIDGLGAPEMVLIFVVVLVLFGGQKLPEFARGLGKSIREFKKAAAGVEEEFKRALEEDERKNSTPKLVAPSSEPVPVTDPDPAADPAGPEAHGHYDGIEDDVPKDPAPHADEASVSPPSNQTPPAEPTILPPASPTPPPDSTPPKTPAVPPPSHPENPS